MGKEGMKNMAASSVLISGLGGLGLEVAKNIILAGVKSVTLHDTKRVTMKDLSSQYFLKKEHLNQNRAAVSKSSLSELNSYVPIYLLEQNLTKECLKNFNIVVLTESSLEEQKEINKFCHYNGIKFINSNTYGLFGQIFCDFGEGFIVNDSTGEEAQSVLIQGITKVNSN